MAKLFEITDDIRQLASDAIDDLIDQLGKACKLIYDAELEVCNNCHFDSTTGRSSGIYNGTGPKSFTFGYCPVCGGTGFLPQPDERSEVVQLLIDWKPKTYGLIASGVQIPDGLVSVKGYLSDMHKVMQSKYLILDYQNLTYQSNRFVKFGEPTPQGNIVRNRYFTALYSRYGT